MLSLDTALVISVLVFVALLLLAGAAYLFAVLRGERERIIGKIRGSGRGDWQAASPRPGPEGQTARRGFFGFLHSVGKKAEEKEEKDVSDVRRALLQAGYRQEYALGILYGARIVAAGLTVALAALLRFTVVRTVPAVIFIPAMVYFVLLGYYMPLWWVRLKAIRRRNRFLEGFPDAIDLMVVCVEAGMGLDATINRVGEEMKLVNPVVHGEFATIGLELRMGKARQEAMRGLARRVDSEDVSSLVSLLVQTDRFGTSVADALRVHADAVRVRRQQRAEEEAAKLPVKLVFPLILFILPALLVTIAGPAVILVYRTFTNTP